MAEVKGLKLEKKDGVGWVILDNPPVNVIGISILMGIHQALEAYKADPGVKVVALRSALERAFSAGVDVSEHAPGFSLGDALAAAHGSIKNLDKPCVFVVNGYCLGGALEMLMDADMAIASERATFGQPEIKVGQLAGSAVYQMPPRMGKARTMELLLTGDRMSAQEALQAGLINKVVPHESLVEEAEKFIKRVTANSAIIVSLTRKAIARACETSVEEGRALANQAYDDIKKTEDYIEGIKAFVEKRAPQWKNH